MRICIAHGGDLGEPSGGTDRVSAIAAGLSKRGADVTLVVPEPSAPLPERLANVDVHKIDTRVLGRANVVTRAVQVSRRAKQIAAKKDATLQFEHSVLAGIGAIQTNWGFVLDMHDLAYSRFDHVEGSLNTLLKTPTAKIERYAAKNAIHTVVVSEFMRDLLINRWDIPKSKVSVVPNGYFPERIKGLPNMPAIEGRVAFLGTLHPKVDVETLAAIARLEDVSELYVIGDGAQRDHLEELSESLPKLTVTGRLPDEEAFNIVARSAVVINPQVRSELQRSSSPVKLFYYMALGKPMVVTGGPPVAEKLADEEAALVVNSREKFIEALQRVLSDDSFASELGRNAIEMAKEFRWSQRIERIEAIHRKIESGSYQ